MNLTGTFAVVCACACSGSTTAQTSTPPSHPAPGALRGPPAAEDKHTNPAWVFATQFEEPNAPAMWEGFDTGTTLVQDPGPFNDPGNTVLRLRVEPGKRGSAGVVKVFPDTKGYDKLYARWYVKYEKGFNFAAPSHGGGLHAGQRWLSGRSGIRPDGTDKVTAWVDYNTKPHYARVPFLYTYYRGMYQDCADPNGRCWGDAFPCVYDPPDTVHYGTKPQHRPKPDAPALPSLEADRWYRVELMMDLGAPTPTESGANGTMELWLDGRSLGHWDDLWMRTTPDLKIILLNLALFHHDGTHSEPGVMYDHVVVSTEPIGATPVGSGMTRAEPRVGKP